MRITHKTVEERNVEERLALGHIYKSASCGGNIIYLYTEKHMLIDVSTGTVHSAGHYKPKNFIDVTNFYVLQET